MTGLAFGVHRGDGDVRPWAGFLLPFLAVVLVAKLLALFLLGPAIFPDTDLYLNLGQEILDGPGWLHDGGWGSGFAPPRLLRPYGYPLLVAAARWVAGERFGLLLGTVQALLSVGVLGLVAVVARRLIAAPMLLVAVLVLDALSGFTLFDAALLTDSFYASLFIAILFVLAGQMLGLWRPTAGAAAALGLAWGLSLGLRDVGLYHTVLPLGGVVLAARAHGLPARRTAVLAGLFLLPVLLLTAAVMGWNLHRTGHAFFAITGGVNWLWPSINMADRGLADPFACADLVCQAAQVHGVEKGMAGVLAIAQTLWQDFHLDPVRLGHATLAHFLATAAHHPLAFVASVLGNMQFGHVAELVFDPLANLNEFARLHSAVGQRLVPGLRELWLAARHGGLHALPWLIVCGLLNGLAIAGLALFVIGTPVRAWKQRTGCTVPLFFWTTAVLFIGSYAIVHMEMRHAMPAVPLILVATGWVVQGIRSERPVG